VAFALVGDPTVLLLDEPTSGVDEPGQERLNELVHRLEEERGLSVLLISHELSLVYRYATTVLCLGRDGYSIGPPTTVLTGSALQDMYGTAVGLHLHDH
jgi:zinc transport system ATP-binding protein